MRLWFASLKFDIWWTTTLPKLFLSTPSTRVSSHRTWPFRGVIKHLLKSEIGTSQKFDPCRCVDVLMCWCVEVVMYWCADVLMCWCVDMLMCWCIDVLMCWCVDVLMYWCVDVLMCWVLMCWCVDMLMLMCWWEHVRIETFKWKSLIVRHRRCWSMIHVRAQQHKTCFHRIQKIWNVTFTENYEEKLRFLEHSPNLCVDVLMCWCVDVLMTLCWWLCW